MKDNYLNFKKMKQTKIICYAVFTISILLFSCENEDYGTPKSKGKCRIVDYCPAPGQFINENGEVSTIEDAIEMAEESIFKENTYVSLGGFGGYIVFGFDHSIKNIAGKDFMIKGNPFVGPNGCSCEPGIVMVMQDANRNGKPDDIWYELKGENHDDDTTIRNYSITYHRPTNGAGDIIWEDNQGNTGQITYIPNFHSQMYYPSWIKEDSYTLTGTLLKHRTKQNPETGFWSNEPFGDGYADNMVAVKNADGEYDLIFGEDGNKFDIDNAMDSNWIHINLASIDFIKVYTAVNIEAGWLGEISTEVFDIKDLNPEYSLCD